jgi:hypothetical protein
MNLVGIFILTALILEFALQRLSEALNPQDQLRGLSQSASRSDTMVVPSYGGL